MDGSGAITAIKARVVCPSSKYQTGTLTSGTVDSSAVDGLVNALYNFPNKTVEWVLDTIEVPLGSWRSVGNSQNCFFLESLLDEVAIGTNQDPIALRRSLLNSGTPTHLRALAVLNALVTASNWNTAPVSGRARGMAMSMSFGDTIVGEVAEVSGSVASGFQVHNVTVVLDCGLAVNPGMVKASTPVRGSPSWSMALTATTSAWVESSPPETPMTRVFAPVALIRWASPWTWTL